MNAQKYFEQHAEELIASFAGKNVVLFFRGFVPANVRWLTQRMAPSALRKLTQPSGNWCRA